MNIKGHGEVADGNGDSPGEDHQCTNLRQRDVVHTSE